MKLAGIFGIFVGVMVIVSPDYFAQQGQWIFVVMFVVLLILALASVTLVASGQRMGKI